jgi:pSer/pThr/pTyr-binding forkhead associated (FHA) protein
VSAPARPAIRDAELVFIEDGRHGRTVTLDKDRTILGRLPDSDVVLKDPGASRSHAEIRHEGEGFVIADLGSTNGTLVNESSVTERGLEDGDRITIGRTVLEFRRR